LLFFVPVWVAGKAVGYVGFVSAPRALAGAWCLPGKPDDCPVVFQAVEYFGDLAGGPLIEVHPVQHQNRGHAVSSKIGGKEQPQDAGRRLGWLAGTSDGSW
jgi:hypothetical protein